MANFIHNLLILARKYQNTTWQNYEKEKLIGLYFDELKILFIIIVKFAYINAVFVFLKTYIHSVQ